MVQPRKLQAGSVLPLLVGPVVVGAVVLDVLALLVDVLVSLVDVLVSLVEPEVVLLVPGSVVGPQPRAVAASSAVLRAGCADDETCRRGWISDAVVACRPGDECDRARSSDAG